jgi:hypothetical protein
MCVRGKGNKWKILQLTKHKPNLKFETPPEDETRLLLDDYVNRRSPHAFRKREAKNDSTQPFWINKGKKVHNGCLSGDFHLDSTFYNTFARISTRVRQRWLPANIYLFRTQIGEYQR